MFAPQLPPDEDRRGMFTRIFTGAGLSITAAVGSVILLALFLVSQHILVSPQELYHRTWNEAQRHLFDPSQMGNWKQWEKKYDGQIKTDEDAVKYANEMLESLKDKYTSLMSNEQVSRQMEEMEGNFTGIGVVLELKLNDKEEPVFDANHKPLAGTDANGYPLVKRVLPGSPAEKAGLKNGDAFKSIDGVDCKNLSLEDLVKKVRGKQGTQIAIEVVRDGKTMPATAVTRDRVDVPSVTVKMLPGDIGYIRLDSFDQFKNIEEMVAGLNKLSKAKSIVFDLRNNPGGLVQNAIGISSLFVEKGTLVTIKSRIPGDPAKPQYETITIRVTATQLISETTRTDKPGQVRTETTTRTPYMLNKRPLVILVNGHSASASEMTTGALQDNGAGTVVGEQTFGKGIGQSQINMPNGTLLHITSLRYYTPKGTWLGDGGNSVRQGLKPDVTSVPSKKVFEPASDDDSQLKDAVDHLNGKH